MYIVGGWKEVMGVSMEFSPARQCTTGGSEEVTARAKARTCLKIERVGALWNPRLRTSPIPAILAVSEVAFGAVSMTKLSEIKPNSRPRVMDLLESLEIDVSDWKKFKGGPKKAASNPKYCYEYTYGDPRFVVINLEHFPLKLHRILRRRDSWRILAG
jgi:hypothetical protein